MFDNRVIFFYDHEDKMAIDYDKWYFTEDKDCIMRRRTYTNLTNATLARLELIVKRGIVHNPIFKNNRVWLPVWFHGKIF